MCALWGRAAWCARGRWPAREPSTPRASLGASARSPARPCHRPRAPQPGPPFPPASSTPVGPGVLLVGSARRLEARPGPAGLAAASNRSGCLCVVWPGPASAHVHCSQAPQGRAACGPTGVPGAGGPGRPRAVRAGSCCLLPRQFSGRRAACPPARRPRRELRSARRLEARPGPAGLAAASNRSGCLCVAWPVPAASLISHVIPLRLLQTSKLRCWNCNIFGAYRKMTATNYVRNLAGGGVVVAHGHRSLALLSLRCPSRQWGLVCCDG